MKIKKKIKQILIGITLINWGMAISFTSHAAQILIVEDNAEIAGIISQFEVSRIALEGDRITAVVGLPAGYSIENDGKSGDIYLVPLPGPKPNRPVNLFLQSEGGNSYQLLLTPQDIPSEQIIIRQSASSPVNQAYFLPEERGRAIANMIKAMRTGEISDDYLRRGAVLSDPNKLLISSDKYTINEVWESVFFRGFLITLSQPANAATISPHAAAVWLASANPGREQLAIIIKEIGDGTR